MRKPRMSVFMLATAVFAAFTLGLFLGRNTRQSPVTVSVSPSMQTSPSAPTDSPVVPTEETTVILFPININSATKEEIMALPGIGEVLAQRILSYRKEHGSFDAPESLMNVEGIGTKRMEEIWDLITVGG